MERQALDRADAGQDPARRLQRAPARRSDGRLLVQPLQRLRRQGTGARVPQRVRARRDPAARARQVPRSAAGHGGEPGDAVLSRQLAELGARGRAHAAPAGEWPRNPRNPTDRGWPARRDRPSRADDRPRTLADLPPGAQNRRARPQRELRARADGAAHARRRRRLHAEGRAGSGARVHRLDDRQSARRAAASGSSRGCTTTARRSCSDTRSRPAADRRTAIRCSTSWRRTRRPRTSSRRSWRGASSPTIRRRRWSSARRARFRETDGDIREVVRTIVTSPEFFAPDAYRAKVKTPFEFVVSAVRATGTDIAQRACRSCRPSATWACRSTAASRRPATPTRPKRGSTPARCSTA